MDQRSIVRTFCTVVLLLAAGFGLAPTSGFAQEGTPAMDGAMGTQPHPAHIHAGSCPDVGDVVFPLIDVVHMDEMGTPMAGVETPATPMAGMEGVEMGDIAVSTTSVDASLEDILAAEHAINVHLSAEEIGTYIACGDITGQPTDGQLEIALEEQNDSGYEGTARLTDTGDGTTTVDIMLVRGGGMAGTPEATPTE